MTATDMQSSGVTPDDALAATVLAPVEWDALVCEFGRREAHFARDLAIRHGIGVEKIDALTSSPLDDRTESELKRTLLLVWNATSRPDTAALQAYYVYARCLAAWERTLDHYSVGQLIGVVVDVWSGVGAMWDTISSPIGILIRHTKSLIDCMATERALNRSCPDDFVDKAARVVDSAMGLRRELAGAPTDAFATLVAHVLDVHGTYYRALVEVGNSVRSMLENPTETDRLDRAITALQQVHNRPPLEHDVYDSELGAHLHLLTRMRSRIGKMCGSPPEVPELDLNRVKYTYVYPFALHGFDRASSTGEIALALWASSAASAGRLIAGQVPVCAAPMEVTDIWSQPADLDEAFHRHGDTAAHMCEHYTGVVVSMPALSVRTTARDPSRPGGYVQLDGYRVEIRLSDFGNHHVVIESPILPQTLHDVNQALRRGSAWMGPELVFNPARARSHLESPVRATEWVAPSTEGEVPERNGLEWAGFAKYASDVVCCLADELTKELNAATDPGMDVSTQSSTSPHAPGDRRRMARFAKYASRATQRSMEHIRHGDNARDRTGLSRAIVPIMDTESDYHVIVEVRSARVRDVDGRQRPATHDDIAAAAGSLLYQPIHRSTITLEEWICCRVPMNVSNLFAETRFDCDFAGRAANTTVLYLPASPNWVYLDYVEMAQFAAALPALLRLWRSQLDEEHAKLLVEIEGSESEEGSEVTKNDAQSATLEHTRLELSGFTARIHGNRAALHSSELVQSPAHRVFFDNLLLAARVPIIDKELDSQVNRVDSLYDRLINFYVVQYERSTRGSQDVMQKILLGLAFLSLAGLASYINDVHFNRENNMTGKQELVQILIVSALAVLVIGCSLLWMRRRNYEFRKRDV